MDLALLARDTLDLTTSPGLPSNQWQFEASRWFETSLVKLQSYIVDFASNTQNLGSNGHVITPDEIPDNPPGVRAAYVSQCENQRIQTSSKVQSFSVLGLFIVVTLTCILGVVSLTLQRCVAFVRRKFHSDRGIARQSDDKLHLLRMAIGDHKGNARWANGPMDIPTMNIEWMMGRPQILSGKLSVYM